MSQTDDLYEILKDGKPHASFDLVRAIYHQNSPTIARLSARIYDISKRYDVRIRSWRDKENETMWWYQIEKVNDGHLFSLEDKTRFNLHGH